MSALLTPDVARAVIEENLKLSGAFRDNLALKHGLPKPVATVLQDKPAEPTVDVSAITKQLEAIAGNIKPPSPGGPAPAAASGLPTWAKAVAAGLTALGIGGGGYAIGNREPAKPDLEPVVIDKSSGSLLQWLHDQGMSVPPGDK